MADPKLLCHHGPPDTLSTLRAILNRGAPVGGEMPDAELPAELERWIALGLRTEEVMRERDSAIVTAGNSSATLHRVGEVLDAVPVSAGNNVADRVLILASRYERSLRAAPQGNADYLAEVQKAGRDAIENLREAARILTPTKIYTPADREDLQREVERLRTERDILDRAARDLRKELGEARADIAVLRAVDKWARS